MKLTLLSHFQDILNMIFQFTSIMKNTKALMHMTMYINLVFMGRTMTTKINIEFGNIG